MQVASVLLLLLLLAILGPYAAFGMWPSQYEWKELHMARHASSFEAALRPRAL
jgi:hypothetical protein